MNRSEAVSRSRTNVENALPYRHSPSGGGANRASVIRMPIQATTRRSTNVIAPLLDCTIILAGGLLATNLLNAIASNTRPRLATVSPQHVSTLVLLAVLVILLSNSLGVYRARKRISEAQETIAVLKAVLSGTALMLVYLRFWGPLPELEIAVLACGTVSVPALWTWKHVQRRSARAPAPARTKNAIVVGSGALGRELASVIHHTPELCYRFVGFVDRAGAATDLVGTIEDFDTAVRANFVEEVFVTLDPADPAMSVLVATARRHNLSMKWVPNVLALSRMPLPNDQLGEFTLIGVYDPPIPRPALAAKRAIDIAGASAALVLLAPLLVVVAVLIRLDSPGPAIYCSWRVGRKGKRFRCYKFRTMCSDADAQKQRLREINERTGPCFKLSCDPRLTRIGRVLRKYSIDELPQFWNVLIGDMSLVGPRPHPLDDFQRYTIEHFRRLDVRPGITGLWQVIARRDRSFETNMKLDVEYIEKWSPLLDLRILLKTVPTVMKGTGE